LTGTLIVIALFALSAGLVGFGLLALMARNRIYYVCTARYLNSIRSQVFEKLNGSFKNLSGYYVNYRKPAYFSLGSIHTLMMILVAGLNSGLFALGFFLLSVDVTVCIPLFVVFWIVQLVALCIPSWRVSLIEAPPADGGTPALVSSDDAVF
jgi:hypothetical protein